MHIEKTPHWIRLELAGEIDLAWREENADELQQVLETCPPVVIIDVENVTFIDSTGLAVVALCYKKCHERAGRLYLTNPKPIVLTAMETVGLIRFVDVVDSCESHRMMYKHLASLDGAAAEDSNADSAGRGAQTQHFERGETVLLDTAQHARVTAESADWQRGEAGLSSGK